ncbi:MAG TPA: hypothetical protein PLZ45_15840 [Ferruginibacter sp.]|nr:hypothetical protein [Chitinophagaceae bacterium]HRI26149.1 hypothetical protein [Ferruginibacter sp.]
MHIVTLFCILLPVLGALPFVIVLIKKKRIEAFKAKAVVTTATVLKAEKKMGFRGSTYYLLSLEYRKVNSNEVYQVKRVVYRKQQPGDVLPAMYLDDDPTRFSLEFGKKTGLMLIVTFIWFLLVAAFCYWMRSLPMSPA